MMNAMIRAVKKAGIIPGIVLVLALAILGDARAKAKIFIIGIAWMVQVLPKM